MKKIIVTTLLFIFSSLGNPAFAGLDLDKIAGAVQEAATSSKNQKNGAAEAALPLDAIQGKLFGKIEAKVNEVIGKIDKYENKIEQYEKKIDQVSKAADQAAQTLNSLDKNEIMNIVKIVKYAVIAIAVSFILSFLLLITLLFQVLKMKALLNKK